MPPIEAFLVHFMSYWKCPLQGHLQCLVCVAGNPPYRGISNTLHVSLDMSATGAIPVPCIYSLKKPPTGAFLVPYIGYSQCFLQWHILCLLCVAENAPYRGMSSAMYMLLEMSPTGAFLVSSMFSCKCFLQGHFQCHVCVAENFSYMDFSRKLYL